MVRCGCMDGHEPPTPQTPLLIVCPRCNEKDDACPSCGGRGRLRIEQDPRKSLPHAAFRVAHLAELYHDKGLPMVAGGALDQSAWFVDASTLCVSDRDRILNDRYGKT